MANKLEIKVCVGSSCHVKGGGKTLKALESLISQSNMLNLIELKADLCLGNCLDAPNVVVAGEVYGGVTPDKVEAFFNNEVLPKVNQ